MRPRRTSQIKKIELVTSTHELSTSHLEDFMTISKNGRRYGIKRRDGI